MQGTAPDSEDQITIYYIPFCLSTWLVAAPGLCPQWKYREPMEESVLFTLTLSPSKEAQGKGEWKTQLLVPFRSQPKPVQWSIQEQEANSDLIMCSVILLVQIGPGRRAEPYRHTHNFLGNSDKQRKADMFIPIWQDSPVTEMSFLSRKERMKGWLFLNSFKNWGHHSLLNEGWGSRSEGEKLDEIITFLHQREGN